jgi:hypothetical protein
MQCFIGAPNPEALQRLLSPQETFSVLVQQCLPGSSSSVFSDHLLLHLYFTFLPQFLEVSVLQFLPAVFQQKYRRQNYAVVLSLPVVCIQVPVVHSQTRRLQKS